MKVKLLDLSNKVIKYSFYILFFLVPLVFWKDTSELYELNKMWLTFGLTIVVLASWVVKSIVLKKFYLQKTPLDIPIALFLGSQIISTIFSLDPYVSLWGYYSRFNGGLISTICYIILYYAFVSNFTKNDEVKKPHGRIYAYIASGITILLTLLAIFYSGISSIALTVFLFSSIFFLSAWYINGAIAIKLISLSIVSGIIVALWGLPSSKGYDPTCLLFRGSLDVSCWTEDFLPKVRIFSTLGQPVWLGAYLAILIPLSIAYFLKVKNRILFFLLFISSILFYVDLLLTKSRSALIGVWLALMVFCGHYYLIELKLKIKNINFKKIWIQTKPLVVLLALFLLFTGIVLNPFELNRGKVQKAPAQAPAGTFSTGGGGTESGKIRLFVWQGALNAWLHNPIIGTGVETFAFAYYKYKPVGHNLTSEWNYLYNKAHNEYLNYLTTSGILGLGSYLFVIFYFFRSIWQKLNRKTDLLAIALTAGYTSILITNFFGFSVVIVNLYFFLIPAFVFVLLGKLNTKNSFVKSFGKSEEKLSRLQKVDIAAVSVAAIYTLLFLLNFWLADQAFARGSNLFRSGEYSSSYSFLKEAIGRIGFEPTYKDELASNDAVFTVGLLSDLSADTKRQKETLTFAEGLAKEAISYTKELTKEHPNNVVFWKTKVRIYYSLSQIDPSYTKDALEAIKKAQSLAPTDANIYYNLALLYGQNGENQKAVETLEQTLKLKPNYISAYYALGLFYRQMATDKSGKVINYELNQKAIDQMNYILKNLDQNNQEAKDALSAFEKI